MTPAQAAALAQGFSDFAAWLTSWAASLTETTPDPDPDPDPPPPPATPNRLEAGTHDDNHVGITYSAGWTVGTASFLYGGSDHYSNVAGSTATFVFYGTGFRIHSGMDQAHGIMGVKVDGGVSQPADLYSGDRLEGMVFEAINLPLAEHTVVLSYTGQKNAQAIDTFITFDKVVVLTGTHSPTPTTQPAPKPVATFPTSGTGPPDLAAVGAKGSLTPSSLVNLSGYHENKDFTSPLQSIAANTHLKNCKYIAPPASGFGQGIKIENCTVTGGHFHEDGTHTGHVITGSKIDGGGREALRPSAAGIITVSDTWLILHNPPEPPSEIHTEAMQAVRGCTTNMTRVAFSTKPTVGSPTTVTASATWDGIGTSYGQVNSCIFGYYDLAAGVWKKSGGAHCVYPGGAKFADTHFYGTLAYPAVENLRPTYH